MIHTHGGDVYSYDGGVIDFSANINPLGIPDELRAAVIRSAELIEMYPDPYCRRLRAAIAEREGVSSEYIVCGNGAAELIFSLTYSLRRKRVIIAAPAFSEYSRAAAAAGAEIVCIAASAETGYVHRGGIDTCIESGSDIVFICNPANPTGALMDRDYIEKVLIRAERTGAVVVADESFLGFVENSEEYSCISLTEKYKRLVVLKSFTKLYAIPGIRVGYIICSDSAVREGIYSSRQPWTVSTAAQEAGIAACKNTVFAERSRKYIADEREYIKKSFNALGIKYEEPHANYIFFYHRAGLKGELIKRGILIRDCSDYTGLKPGCFRAAIRTREENMALIQGLAELGNEKQGG